VVDFEIATKHQFGYNPEELISVIQGKIKLDDVMIGSSFKLITSPVYNLQGEKVGHLKVNVRLGGKSKPPQAQPKVFS
jgi:hypothetical protein